MRCSRLTGSGRAQQFLAMLQHEAQEIRLRYGRAEQKTLHLRAAQRAEEFLLSFRFHALGRRRHVARLGDADDRLHDGERAIRPADILDERAVDFDLVERKTLQIAQRGVTGSEIVERNPYTEVAQLMQDAERRLDITD